MLLTTVAGWKTWAGVTGTADDGALAVIVPAVSDAIARYLGRDLASTTYKTWLDGNGHTRLRLPQYPITRIYAVSLDSDAGIRISFAGGTRANVNCDGTTLQLYSISTAGVATDTSITLATYPTMTLLAAQINTISGWTATVSTGKGSEYSPAIKPFDTGGALSPDYVELEIPDDGEEARIVSQTAGMIEFDEGCVFPSGRANVFIWYAAGYTLPTEVSPTSGNVPGGLSMAANQVVSDVLNLSKTDTTMQSETIGGYSYTRGSAVVQSAVHARANLLGLFRRYEA